MKTLRVGDKCRVKQLLGGLGDTLWEVTEVDGFYVRIREFGTCYASQEFDTSLLEKVDVHYF